jgi:hypothetical protein
MQVATANVEQLPLYCTTGRLNGIGLRSRRKQGNGES